MRGLTEAAQVSIADNGPGLPESEMTRIFEPFMTKKPHGVGLGLAISRSIIEDHGGKIGAEANPGGGLVVCFTVPCDKSETRDATGENRLRN